MVAGQGAAGELSVKASVVILAWNGMAYLADCLNAVFAQDYLDFEVIVVDNGSTDGSADFVAAQYPQVRLIRNERNLGFAAGNNVGLRAATGDVLVLLNQDTEVRPGWLAALVEAVQDLTVGIAGCKLLYPDGTIQHAGGYLHGDRGATEHYGRHELDVGQYDIPRDVEFVTGAALALTRETWKCIGPLDEEFAPAYFEDTDWCFRAQAAGRRVVYWPAAVAVHKESASAQVTSWAHLATYNYGRLRFLFKHQPLAWLQERFYPAEAGGLRDLGGGSTLELTAERAAYARLLFALPGIVAFRAQELLPSESLWASLLSIVLSLRDVCGGGVALQDVREALEVAESKSVGARILAQEPESVMGQAYEDAVSDAEMADFALLVPPEIQPLTGMAQLQTQWKIEPQPFHSAAPVIGSAVAAFREAWNNVATRWYVQPLLEQQVAFNQAAVTSMTALSAQLTALRNATVTGLTELRDITTALRNTLTGQLTEIAITQVELMHIMQTMQQIIAGLQLESTQHTRELTILMQRLAYVEQCLAASAGESRQGDGL